MNETLVESVVGVFISGTNIFCFVVLLIFLEHFISSVFCFVYLLDN